MTNPKTEVAETAEQGPKELSEQWLDLARTGRETMVETLAEFVETVEKVVPVGAGIAKQRQVIESGLEMAQAIARAQANAMRSVTRSVVLVKVEVDTDVDVDVDVTSRESAS